MRIHGGFVLAAGLACALQAAAAVPPPEILVLSNRADLISGGDALVEIKMPPIYTPPVAKVTLNGVPANQFFALRPNGRYMGVVSGLKDGTNVLVARAPGGPAAQIIITNHPIGGPVFAGPQLQPWICATRVATTVTVVGNPGSTPATATATTRASGLNDDPTNDQCDTPPTYTYFYQPVALQGSNCTFATSGANACFTAYAGPASRPADSAIANFTNDRGDTVKSLIRVERGIDQPHDLHAGDLLRPARRQHAVGAAEGLERQAGVAIRPQRRGQPLRANAGEKPVRRLGRSRAAAGLHDRYRVADRPRHQFQRHAGGRNGDDAEGAHHRELRRDSLHDRRRLLGRLDHAAEHRVGVSGLAQRHSTAVQLPRHVHHLHRDRRLR